jgi:Ca2+-binding RTX toxin-like protein
MRKASTTRTMTRKRGAAAALLCVTGLATAGLTTLGAAPAAADGDCPDDGTMLVGTSGDDVLVGTAGPDTILGRGGDDILIGQGGEDSLYGGPGGDLLIGGRGEDCVSGGQDDDWLSGDDWQHQSTEVDEMDGGEGDFDEVWITENGETSSDERWRY